ncbi:MAG: cupin domain-containing protein [Thermomicrobiales bacterium]|nr:cupin domain-containing protein [Thermomicrobiales bacterium]
MVTDNVRNTGAVQVRPGEGRSARLLGEVYTVKLGGADTGGVFALVEQTIPAGTSGPPPHRHHQTDETFYIVDGEMAFMAGDATIHAGTGDVVRVPRGLLHTYRNVGEGTARLMLTVTPAGFEEFFLAAGEAPDAPAQEPPDIGRLLTIGERYDLDVPPPPAE